MSSHEKAEQQITKSSAHGNDSSHAFRNEYLDSARNATMSIGGQKHDEKTTDLPKLVIDGVSSAFAKEGEQIWKDLDKNPTTHFIKHDYCNDEPIKVGIAVAGLATVGAIATVAAMPEVTAAGAIYSVGTVLSAVAGVANIDLAVDYLKRHPVW